MEEKKKRFEKVNEIKERNLLREEKKKQYLSRKKYSYRTTKKEKKYFSPEEREKIAEKVCKNKVKSFVDFSLQTPKIISKKPKEKKALKIPKKRKSRFQSIEDFNKNMAESPKTMSNSFKPEKIKIIASSAFKTV